MSLSFVEQCTERAYKGRYVYESAGLHKEDSHSICTARMSIYLLKRIEVACLQLIINCITKVFYFALKENYQSDRINTFE